MRNYVYRSDRSKRSGFTLLELVVCILLIATLSTAVVMTVQGRSGEANVAATASVIRLINEAAVNYRLETGEWPAEVVAATLPSELEPYLRSSLFTAAVPVGGVWDWSGPSGNKTVGISIRFATKTFTGYDDLDKLDKLIDDGDVLTGNAVLISESIRSYYVVAADAP